MYSFRQFLILREADLPIPPGVDPGMWENPSYQKFWLATPQGREWFAQQQTGQGQKAVARALPKQLTLPDVESEIRDYLSKQGSKDYGNVRELDKSLQDAINQMVRVGTIVPEASPGKARMSGGGIHFYRSPTGLGFIVNARGIKPMSVPYGRAY